MNNATIRSSGYHMNILTCDAMDTNDTANPMDDAQYIQSEHKQLVEIIMSCDPPITKLSS